MSSHETYRVSEKTILGFAYEAYTDDLWRARSLAARHLASELARGREACSVAVEEYQGEGYRQIQTGASCLDDIAGLAYETHFDTLGQLGDVPPWPELGEGERASWRAVVEKLYSL